MACAATTYNFGVGTMNLLRRFFGEESGPTAVEYAVMLALIIVMCIGSIILVGQSTAQLWSDNDKGLESVFKGGDGE